MPPTPRSCTIYCATAFALTFCMSSGKSAQWQKPQNRLIKTDLLLTSTPKRFIAGCDRFWNYISYRLTAKSIVA